VCAIRRGGGCISRNTTPADADCEVVLGRKQKVKAGGGIAWCWWRCLYASLQAAFASYVASCRLPQPLQPIQPARHTRKEQELPAAHQQKACPLVPTSTAWMNSRLVAATAATWVVK